MSHDMNNTQPGLAYYYPSAPPTIEERAAEALAYIEEVRQYNLARAEAYESQRRNKMGTVTPPQSFVCPFKVGDRVRLKPQERSNPAMKVRSGRIKRVTLCPTTRAIPEPYWRFDVERVGVKNTHVFHVNVRDGVPDLNSSLWELVPLHDLAIDQVAQDLADRVKAGETDAALVLADRVMELCGGTARVCPVCTARTGSVQ